MERFFKVWFGPCSRHINLCSFSSADKSTWKWWDQVCHSSVALFWLLTASSLRFTFLTSMGNGMCCEEDVDYAQSSPGCWCFGFSVLMGIEPQYEDAHPRLSFTSLSCQVSLSLSLPHLKINKLLLSALSTLWSVKFIPHYFLIIPVFMVWPHNFYLSTVSWMRSTTRFFLTLRSPPSASLWRPIRKPQLPSIPWRGWERLQVAEC